MNSMNVSWWAYILLIRPAQVGLSPSALTQPPRIKTQGTYRQSTIAEMKDKYMARCHPSRKHISELHSRQIIMN